ncbi:hypothetical protein HGG76_26990 [Ochrobactrum tritici]|uniref:Uncharacterized protein n=1 Tax=Brucella tritici TaxID=94626 RepID=A0A7X6JDL4_9HYPH|nr:hypothetical protein [Brucella tritici]
MVQYVIDKGQEELFFGPLNCRGFSLKGLFSVAADDTLNARIADFIMMKHKELPNSVPLKVLEAANYYLGAWRAMADGTRESVRMSLTSTFGAIVSDEQLCFRFASGVFDADNDNGVGNVRPRMRKISDVLNGAIFGIALGRRHRLEIQGHWLCTCLKADFIKKRISVFLLQNWLAHNSHSSQTCRTKK